MSSTKPNYTSYKKIQDEIVANPLSIISYTTELVGHLTLTRTPVELNTPNGAVAFTVPMNASNDPTPPPHITTRASTTILAADPTVKAETLDPCQAQESLRIFQENQHEYNRYCNHSTALKNCKFSQR